MARKRTRRAGPPTRPAGDPQQRLAAATAEVERAEVEQAQAVAGARAAGVSWSEIARLAGLKSAQAAHYRWGPSTTDS